MIESIAALISPVLTFTPVRRVRRNHGLEHATVHMLARQVRNLRIAGRAEYDGFILYGEADTEQVRTAVTEALDRMRSGEHGLAVHPNCGTGLVTTGLMTSIAAVIGFAGTRGSIRDILNRLPLAMILSIFALIISQPIGLSLQRYITTLGDPGDIEVIGITRHQFKLPLTGSETLTVHRVKTRHG